MTDIAIFPIYPQEMMKMDPVTFNCNQMNQIDFKSNLSSENSSQTSSCEVEIESENKIGNCTLQVMNTSEQQKNSFNSYNPEDFNDAPYIYSNSSIELKKYKCDSDFKHANYNGNNFSSIPWSTEEDELIKDFIKKDQKISKSQIKEKIPNIWVKLANVPLLLNNKRSAKDIKHRWSSHLDPFAVEERLKGPWTNEEDILLAKLHEIYGNCWNKIASFIPGRTELSVKNRWNSHLKAKLRSKLESQMPSLSTSTVISTPSNLLNSIFQNESSQKKHHFNDETSQNKSDSLRSSCQFLIIDDLDGNDLSKNLFLDDSDQSFFLEICKNNKKKTDDTDDQNKSCQPIKNKERTVLLDCKMPPQIKSPNLNTPFNFFGPWPNTYYAGY